MDELLGLLKEILPKVDFESGTDLVDDGVIDSLDVVSIISELNVHYDIEIPSDEIVPENFNDAEAIFDLVNRLLDE